MRTILNEHGRVDPELYEHVTSSMSKAAHPTMVPTAAIFGVEDWLKSKREECPLSSRQLQVLQAVANHGDRAAAARSLYIALHTLKSHLQHIKKALGEEVEEFNGLQLVIYALRRGWIY